MFFPLRDTQPSYSKPIVTALLIVINVLVFLFEFSLDDYSRNAFIAYYGLVPDRFAIVNVLTSMFLHGGWLHILGNMWFLWIFGNNIEDSMGHARFVVFYLLCGVAAAAAQMLVAPRSVVPMVGASGAISGVMGAYTLLYPRVRVHTLVTLGFFVTTVTLPAYVMLGYWFVLQLLMGAVGALSPTEGGVAVWAHVGGFLTGLVLVKLFANPEFLERRRAGVFLRRDA